MYPSPNPVLNRLTMNYKSGTYEDIAVEILDLRGKPLKVLHLEKDSESEYYEIDTAHLSSGVYFVRVIQDDSQVAKKFIKQ